MLDETRILRIARRQLIHLQVATIVFGSKFSGSAYSAVKYGTAHFDVSVGQLDDSLPGGCDPRATSVCCPRKLGIEHSMRSAMAMQRS
jgi:hypothetical protein